MGKERDVGPKGGDRQPGHEGGREGNPGTRPSGTGTWGGQQRDDPGKSSGNQGGSSGGNQGGSSGGSKKD